MRVIIKNDGTDEIFNLHEVNISSAKELLESMFTFIGSGDGDIVDLVGELEQYSQDEDRPVTILDYLESIAQSKEYLPVATGADSTIIDSEGKLGGLTETQGDNVFALFGLTYEDMCKLLS